MLLPCPRTGSFAIGLKGSKLLFQPQPVMDRTVSNNICQALGCNLDCVLCLTHGLAFRDNPELLKLLCHRFKHCRWIEEKSKKKWGLSEIADSFIDDLEGSINSRKMMVQTLLLNRIPQHVPGALRSKSLKSR